MSSILRKLAVHSVVALVCIVSIPAHAQERLFVINDSFNGFVATTIMAELDTSDAALGTVRRTVQLPTYTGALALMGGRYLALHHRPNGTGPTTIGIFDTRTFRIVVSLTFPSGVTLEADAFHPRLFYRTATEVGVMEAPLFGRRILRATSDIATLDSMFCCGPLRYAGATNTLFVTRTVSPTQFEMAGIDVETSALRGGIPLTDPLLGLIVDNTARQLIMPVRVGLSEKEIRAYDLDTFALLTKTAAYQLPGCSFGWLCQAWAFDVARQQLLGWVESGASTPWAYSLDSNLMLKAYVDFGYLQINPAVVSMNLTASTVRERIFAVVGRPDYSGTYYTIPGKDFLVSLDATTLQPIATVDLLKSLVFKRGDVRAILLKPPPPPSPLSSSVADRRVDLTWRDPSDTTHYIVEVGTVPGRSNVGMLHVGNTTAWSADGVPPGTYYVRVRAINDVGLSLPSNEVVVTVR